MLLLLGTVLVEIVVLIVVLFFLIVISPTELRVNDKVVGVAIPSYYTLCILILIRKHF